MMLISDNDTTGDQSDGANDGVDIGDDAHDDDGGSSIVTTVRIMIDIKSSSNDDLS